MSCMYFIGKTKQRHHFWNTLMKEMLIIWNMFCESIEPTIAAFFYASVRSKAGFIAIFGPNGSPPL